MKRVLLTGASGFIGRQTLPILRAHGYEVHAVYAHTPLEVEGVAWHQADLLQASQRRALMSAIKPTHVLHFAWIATPGVYWTSPLNDDWREATVDLLTLSRTFGVQRFVGAGSCAEYDWSPPGHCDEVATPLAPATPYGRAKAAAAEAVIAASGESMRTAWGRIFHLFGPNEHPSRLVPSVIRSLLEGKRAQCTHGAQVRDVLHVRDVASAFVSLLESSVTGAVNIASGNPVTLRDVVETIARQLSRPDAVDFGAIPAPENDPPRLTAAVARLTDELGWHPSLSLEEGIADAIRWWRTQR